MTFPSRKPLSALVCCLCLLSCTPVLRNDYGGNVQEYLEWADRLSASETVIEVWGVCASACTITMDRARKNFCVTERTELWFHQATVTVGGTFRFRKPVDYSPDINQWIEDRGGQPLEGFLVMNAKEAQRFWKSCE